MRTDICRYCKVKYEDRRVYGGCHRASVTTCMKIVPNFVVETIQLMPVLNCQCYCQMTSHSGIRYYVIKTTSIVLIQV